MAFRLTKGESKTKSELSTRLDKAFSVIETAISEAQENIEAAIAPVNTAIDAYNAVLEDVRSFVNDLGANHRESFDSKSEAWQEGDRGQEADNWIRQFEDFEAEDVEHVEVEFAPDISNVGEELDNIEEAAE